MNVSPFHHFDRSAWACLRADTPMKLTFEELETLRGLNDPVSLNEVEEIYLPLSRLIFYYVAASQELFHVTARFLGRSERKVPFVIGVAGSVAVGKSTFARLLRLLLSRWENAPNVELITTDGFLLPNAQLQTQGLLMRKGFPESYDLPELLKTLDAIKSGADKITIPLYSHHIYDRLEQTYTMSTPPDIVIVEGLNVLQVRKSKEQKPTPMVSDYFDLSIFIDADEENLKKWYMDRFMTLRATAFQDKGAYFHRYATLTDEEALSMAQTIWDEINAINLKENILPTKPRADVILHKSANHEITTVMLKKI